jgi:transcriptional regulator with XRE-family HTH domain
MYADTFGPRLRELRLSADLTQGQLAAKAGLTETAVGYLERGLREPTWSTVIALADALGVKCGEFQKSPGRKKK